MIRSVTLSELTNYLHFLLESPEPSVRHWLAAYARDHGIVV